MVNFNEQNCPVCGGELRCYDTIKRMIKKKRGIKEWIILQRVICRNCGKVHRELPDDILPYKHYTKTIIDGFISDELSTTDLDYDVFPCDGTVANWKSEFGHR